MDRSAYQKIKSMLNKVPEVTLSFWIVKILSTTVGETGADYLAVHVGWGAGVTSAVMALLLIFALLVQIRVNRYIPSIYWFTVVLVSVVGTQITDILTDKLDVSLYISTGAFSVALAATFVVWFRSEKTLSMDSIRTRRREAFYWLAILFTFALGTAAGDLATEALGLGFTIGTIVFGGLIALTAGAYYFGLKAVTAFWVTYILTRPLGASLGDLLSQSKEYGGIGFGAIWTSVIFLSIIVAIVAYLSVKQNRDLRLSSDAGRVVS